MQFSTEYIAGFFDGEGCVHILEYKKGNGRSYFALRVFITQTDFFILNEMKKMYGGSIQSKKKKLGEEHHRQAWNWILRCRQAQKFLEDIYPHLFLKKEQARLAIEFQKEVPSKHSGIPLTLEQVLSRSQFKKEISKLNHHKSKKVEFSQVDIN